MLNEVKDRAFYPIRLVMDPSVSPLRYLHPARRFQIMTILGMMWTSIFCLGTGSWLYYGELVVFHLLLALGVLVTGLTFYNSAKAEPGRSMES